MAREAADTLQAEEDGVAARGHRPADASRRSTARRWRPRSQKTGRAVIVHEAPQSFGPGAEIAAVIMEGAFLSLEAPIARVTAATTCRSPASRARRRNVPDVARVLAAARETLAF